MGKEIPPLFPHLNSNKKLKRAKIFKLLYSHNHCYLGIYGDLLKLLKTANSDLKSGDIYFNV